MKQSIFRVVLTLSISLMLVSCAAPLSIDTAPTTETPTVSEVPVAQPESKFPIIESPEDLKLIINKENDRVFYMPDSPEFPTKFAPFLALYNANPSFQKVTEESFLNTVLMTTYPIFYTADINNDGSEEYIFAYSNMGTGNYAGIDQVYGLKDGLLEIIPIPEPLSSALVDTQLFNLMTYKETTYIHMTDMAHIDSLYLWENLTTVNAFTDSIFVENGHLDRDQTAENKRISEKYAIQERLKVLETEKVDYSNSGYSNEESLIAYYNIKDAIEANDQKRVSELVVYPLLRWSENGEMSKIYSPTEFVAQYDSLVTDAVKNALKASTDNTLMSSWRGLMIGNGEIWFTNFMIGLQ